MKNSEENYSPKEKAHLLLYTISRKMSIYPEICRAKRKIPDAYNTYNANNANITNGANGAQT